MNNETRLLLESLNWVIRNVATKRMGVEYDECRELQGRINDCLYPEEKPSVAEQTNDGLLVENKQGEIRFKGCGEAIPTGLAPSKWASSKPCSDVPSGGNPKHFLCNECLERFGLSELPVTNCPLNSEVKKA